MPATLIRNGDNLELDLSTCRGPEFKDTLEKIRSIPGRKFDFDRKLWLVPAEPLVAERVMLTIQPNADQTLTDWVRQARVAASEELTTPLPEDAELLIPWATMRAPWQPEWIEVAGERTPFTGLMRHQRPVVDLAARVRKLLIADDMGLGKTGTAISSIEEFRERHKLPDGFTKPDGPRLVIAPNSVKGSWLRELKLWLGKDVAAQVVDGTTIKSRHNQLLRVAEAADDNPWAIINWEQLRVKKVEKKLRNGGSKKITVLKEPLFEEIEWLAVVADEIHRAKNRKAQATQGLWRVRADDGMMLGMSGTPLMNSPDELWAILAWLWPDDYHKAGANHAPGARAYWTFYEQYVDYFESYQGKVVTGVKNPDELRFELKDRLVRRTKGQVLDLPPKFRVPVPLTLNKKQRKLYDEAEEAMWLEIEQAVAEGDKAAADFAKAAAEGGDALTRVMRIPNGAARTVRLRQIIESPALLGGEDDSAVFDTCVERILDSQPNQWVVWVEFVESCDILAERLRAKGLRVAVYNGSVTPDEREVIETNFQRGDIDVVVGTIKAMYQGITLTAADKQFWCTRDWVPAVNEQGEDRLHRIGQRNAVTILIAQPEETVAVSKVEPTNRVKESIVRSVIPTDHVEERVNERRTI